MRALGQRVLEQCSYTVLSACDAQAGLEFARDYPHQIEPAGLRRRDATMGGRKLAEAIAKIRTATKVMFVSGYTDDDVLLHGMVLSEVTMLPKPYSLTTQAQTIRRVLEG